MTTPFSRTKALVQTEELLLQLADPTTLELPEAVRAGQGAAACVSYAGRN